MFAEICNVLDRTGVRDCNIRSLERSPTHMQILNNMLLNLHFLHCDCIVQGFRNQPGDREDSS